MKKFLLLILVMVYTTASFGIGIRAFYCCNQLKSTELSFATTAQKHCGMKMEKDDCCKTQFKYVKLRDSHLASDQVNSPAKPITDLHFTLPSFRLTVPDLLPEAQLYPRKFPPADTGTPLYIFCCVYRI